MITNLEKLKKMIPPHSLYLGVDGSISTNDTCILGAVSNDGTIEIRFVSITSPSGGVINLTKEFQKIVDLWEMRLLNIVAIDRSGLYPWISELERLGIPYKDVPQNGAPMEIGTELLIDAAQKGRIVFPDDKDLRQHLGNSRLKDTTSGGIRVTKSRFSGLNNDAAVCLAMIMYVIDEIGFEPATIIPSMIDPFEPGTSTSKKIVPTVDGDAYELENGSIFDPVTGLNVSSVAWRRAISAMKNPNHDVRTCPARKSGLCRKCNYYFDKIRRQLSNEEYEKLVKELM